MSEVLAQGILGGVMGGANAVVELSLEKRKELAEKLKREALEEISKRSDARRHGYNQEIQKTNIAAEEKQSAADIESREKVSSERNQVLERIAVMEDETRQEMMQHDKQSTEAQNLRAKVAALTEARKVIESGGTNEEANAVLEAAGLPPMEEFVIDEGSPGFLGFGKTDPIMGRRVAGSSDQPTGGGLKPELAALLAEGRKSMPAETMVAENDQEQPPEREKASGLISSALADSAPIAKPELGDPSKWDVRQQAGKFFLITSEGPREMTPEQIQQWRQATEVQGL